MISLVRACSSGPGDGFARSLVIRLSEAAKAPIEPLEALGSRKMICAWNAFCSDHIRTQSEGEGLIYYFALRGEQVLPTKLKKERGGGGSGAGLRELLVLKCARVTAPLILEK
jgi:hypothetical protein